MKSWTNRRNVSEEESPAKVFATRDKAVAAADVISTTPKSGIARVQFSGAADGWLVEVRPRNEPYCNPYFLREDGTVANYH